MAERKETIGYVWYPSDHAEHRRLLARCNSLLDTVLVKPSALSADRRRRYTVFCGTFAPYPIAVIASEGALVSVCEQHGAYACEHETNNCTELTFNASAELTTP